MTAAPPEGATTCSRCTSGVVVVHDPPAVIETRRGRLDPPMYFEHTSQRCRDLRVLHEAARAAHTDAPTEETTCRTK